MTLISIVVYGALLITVVIVVAVLSLGNSGVTTKANSFYTEKQALKVLGISKEVLNTMVSEEILRTYQNHNGTVYRKEDIEELSRNHKN